MKVYIAFYKNVKEIDIVIGIVLYTWHHDIGFRFLFFISFLKSEA